MVCDCVERFRNIVESRRGKATLHLERDLPLRLDGFADAMRLGAVQLVARNLLKAGVYRASLDLAGSRKVEIESSVEAVRRVAAARPRLQEFVGKYWQVLVEQSVYVDPENVLPHRIRNRERLSETFGGYIDRSLDAAERSLDLLDDLERRLPVWKSLVRGADVPRVEPVMDFHDSQR